MTSDELADFMVDHARIVDATIRDGGGTLVKYINDSALGVFEGDDVDGAVRTLLELKRRVESSLSRPVGRSGSRLVRTTGRWLCRYFRRSVL
ncbi:MAG: hypothetical protein WD492_11170 [Alkalispirochaeta sp.]